MTHLMQALHDGPHPAALPILSYPGAQLVDRTVRDLVTDPHAQMAAQIALHHRFRTGALLTAMDLSAEAEEFGCTVHHGDDEPPTVLGRLVTGLSAVRRLAVPTPGTGRTRVYLETVRLLVAWPDRPPLVLAGMIGPFSLACRLYGVSEAMALTIQDPELMHTLVEKATAFLRAYARAFKEAGADGVIIAEPTAGLLSPPAMQQFSSSYIRQIVQAVQDEKFTVCYHNCAAKRVHLPAILETAAGAVHFGPPMDLRVARAEIPAHILVAGNIDPSQVLVQGNPGEVQAAVCQLREQMRGAPNFLLSSGCDVPARASLANLEAFFAAAA